MSKIKTLIAHNDIKTTNDIIDSIKELDYVEILDNNIPIFNIIGDEIPDNELKQAIDIVGKKLNALIKEPYENRITDILNDYKNIL